MAEVRAYKVTPELEAILEPIARTMRVVRVNTVSNIVGILGFMNAMQNSWVHSDMKRARGNGFHFLWKSWSLFHVCKYRTFP